MVSYLRLDAQAAQVIPRRQHPAVHTPADLFVTAGSRTHASPLEYGTWPARLTQLSPQITVAMPCLPGSVQEIKAAARLHALSGATQTAPGLPCPSSTATPAARTCAASISIRSTFACWSSLPLARRPFRRRTLGWPPWRPHLTHRSGWPPCHEPGRRDDGHRCLVRHVTIGGAGLCAAMVSVQDPPAPRITGRLSHCVQRRPLPPPVGCPAIHCLPRCKGGVLQCRNTRTRRDR